jgi:hypothetical protein
VHLHAWSMGGSFCPHAAAPFRKQAGHTSSSENASMDQGTKHTPKFAKQEMSIDTSAHALKRTQTSSAASYSKTPLSTNMHQSFLRTPTTAHDEKKHSDMGEMGYLHLRVHCLVNLDNGLAREAKPDLTRALFSAELVTSDYNRKKTIFTNGDITKHHAWGDGLFFRIFQVLILLHVLVCRHDTAL